MSPDSSSSVEVRLARHAMATRFELVLQGNDPIQLRALGEEALEEVDRIENLLSLYRPHTDIARINRQGADHPVRVSPEVIGVLERARQWNERTGGAFDPTAGALFRAWGFHQGSGHSPSEAEIQAALACCGWPRVELDPDRSTVRLLQPGVTVDLGAIGKGYALDRAAEILREGGVTRALLQGGTSSVLGIGTPEGTDGWRIALPAASSSSGQPHPVQICDCSLSVSAPSGKGFVDARGIFQGHVLDPRTGQPTAGLQFAAVSAVSAADSDALSTALLVDGMERADHWVKAIPGLRCWVSYS